MDYSNILTLSPQNLYDEALKFKSNQDYTNYHMYMMHAANLKFEPAVKELFDDYQNTYLHK
ncbi:MAG: hypothetical protein MUO21_01885, partial [Nitrososphaeraceae archaeon]|nr:hypothetical protein [Nitrososphaeraceae archaeon]